MNRGSLFLYGEHAVEFRWQREWTNRKNKLAPLQTAGPDGGILALSLSRASREIDLTAGLMVVDLPQGLR